MLRNAGFTNYRFTGCPALYSVSDGVTPTGFRRDSVRRIVFSCGAPGMMIEDDVVQHQDVILMLRRFFPKAEIVVAAHHTADASVYKAVYGKVPAGWCRLMDIFRKMRITTVDISGALAPMKNLYSTADLHVGYRVHAHVLMTSWGRPSVLIAEDGRASGMVDVISGKVFSAWKYVLAPPSALRWCSKQRVKNRKLYDVELPRKIEQYLEVSENRVLNAQKYGPDVMEKWFSQFKGGRI